MRSLPLSSDDLRAMYVGGRANVAARRFARAWAVVFAKGVVPRRWVTLERAPLAEFATVAASYPAFRVQVDTEQSRPQRSIGS